MSKITDRSLNEYISGHEELKELLDLDAETLQALRGRAQYYFDEGHDERALIMLEMLEELDRGDDLPTHLAVATLLRLGRSDEAEAKVTRLLTRKPEDLDALVMKAEVLLSTGMLVPAAEALHAVVTRDPEAKTEAGQRARALAAKAHAVFEAASSPSHGN